MSNPPNSADDYKNIKQRLAEIEDNLVITQKECGGLFENIDARLDRLVERDDAMDQRIADILSAIGQFITSQPHQK